MRTAFCWILAASALYAQQVAAPTGEPVGSSRGEDVHGYNITNSFEAGYRYSLVDGDLGKYRSDVNYRNGIRLFSSGFSVNSKDGHGRYFDEILLNTLGLGNDPYQSATLRIQKNGLYRYDMMWRLNEYYNPGLTISGGSNLLDTRRRLQDHDLTLLPQSRFRLRVGYSRDTQTGPALTSTQEYTLTTGGVYEPQFTNVRREWNEYRVGGEGELAGFKFSVMHRWDYYKDDPVYDGFASGPNLNVGRAEPVHGSNPGWMGNIFTRRKYWGVNGHITYVGGRRDFALSQAASGAVGVPSPSNLVAINQQVLVSGNAARPVTSGDFNLNVFPSDKLTVVNNTSIHSTRIDGNAAITQFDNLNGNSANLNFRYLGVVTVANATDVNYRLNPFIGFYGGYHYSNRTINTIEGFSFSGPVDDTSYARSGHLHAGVFGVQVRPRKPLTIRVEGEVGRDNHPFTPISDKNYHTINGRIDYRTRKVQLSGSYRQVYNVNAPFSITSFASHSRDYTFNASWSPKDRFSIDASYMKLHLDNVSSLVFFAGVNTVSPQNFSTIYVSNIHAANLMAHFAVTRRADLYAGYSITKDTGDGRSAAAPAGADPVQTLFDSVETFPLTFHSPLVRFSFRISPKLRWNAGWQFYRYREDFGVISYHQNYRANTGYTSLSWSF